MTTPVKTFFTKVTDEYGGEYPQAFVAVRAFSETSQKTGISENCTTDYDVKSEIEAITYKVNYWYTDQTKAQGKRSRPLINDIDGVFSDVFTVNLEDPEIIQILEGPLEHFDKVLHAIVADVTKKFS